MKDLTSLSQSEHMRMVGIVLCTIDTSFVIFLNFCLHAAPSGPPTNFQATADTSRSLVLSWDPPLPHHQNGIVRMYTVTISNNTVQLANISTTANGVRITAQIRPFRTYICSVVAKTVAVGPATENIAVQTPEDSEFLYIYALQWLCKY